MKWKYVQLDKFCDSVRDGTHDTPKKTDSGYKLITAKHINNDGIDFSEAYLISENDYNHINERSKVEKWDVLMSMIGNGLGKSFIVSEEPDYAIKNLALFKTGNEYKAKWLHYFLSSSFGQGIIYSKLQGTGQPFISLSFLRKMKIIIPSSEKEMIKIASILSTYDSLIENNTKRIRLLEQMAENLYKEWFVRFRFPGHENVEMENGLPKGWKIEKLDAVADVIMGQSPESKYYNEEGKGMPFHQGVGSYGDFYLINSIYSTEGKRIAEPFSIIFSVRAPVGRININLNRILLGRGVASINEKNGNNAFLLWCLKDKFAKEDSIGNGSIFTSVTKDELLKQKITIPSDSLLKQFNSIAKSIEKEIRLLTQKNTLLTRQRDLLLPRLMSGKLEVTV